VLDSLQFLFLAVGVDTEKMTRCTGSITHTQTELLSINLSVLLLSKIDVFLIFATILGISWIIETDLLTHFSLQLLSRHHAHSATGWKNQKVYNWPN